MRFVHVILFTILFSGVSWGQGYDDILNATARLKRQINQDQVAIGSAVAYYENEKEIYLLTAGHCLVDSENVIVGRRIEERWIPKPITLRFYSRRIPSHPIDAQIVFWDYGQTDDIGIVKVQKSDFGDYPLPNILRLKTQAHLGPVIGVGCPGGSAPCIFKATIDDYQHTSEFRPAPVGGHSGGALVDEETRSIVGVIIQRFDDKGKATSTTHIYDLVGWKL